ncbi:MAG TPA: hypothetical protein VKA95_02930 [Nitrososphaeraceae archaeon]|nr:hypothetical protein [Nitrososphaeraceae archaeon]
MAINKFYEFFFGTIDYQLVTNEMTSDIVIHCFTDDIFQGLGDYELANNIRLSRNESHIQVVI